VQHLRAAGGAAGGWVQAPQPAALWWSATSWRAAAAAGGGVAVGGCGGWRGVFAASGTRGWGRRRGEPPLVDARGRYAPGRRPELEAWCVDG